MRTKQGPARMTHPPKKRRKLESESDEEASAPRGNEDSLCCTLGVIRPAAGDIIVSQARKGAGKQPTSPWRGVDRISQLPDAVLGDIISLLPTKEGARTQVLASSWRHLWRSAPLNLDCAGLSKDTISHVLSVHPGPSRRFCRPLTSAIGHVTMHTWFRSPAMDHLQELDFSRTFKCQPPPASTFRFSATLRVATFQRCSLPYGPDQVFHFPKLERLTLENLIIPEDSLHSMIHGCPSLECLLIIDIDSLRCLRINSLTLKSIAVCFHSFTRIVSRQLVMENAPCLQRLLHHNSTDCLLAVTVIYAPKLETLGRISGFDNNNGLVFGDTVIQGLHVESLTTVVHAVKILAVSMDTLILDIVINLMRCFPSLQKLYIKAASASKEKNSWRLKHRDLVKCHDIRLKTIVVEYYHGIISQVNFVTFFLLNAKALELMKLRVRPKYYNEKFLAQQHNKLQLEKMASTGAMVHFTTHKCIRHASDIDHVRDLSLRDPFHCSCCQ